MTVQPFRFADAPAHWVLAPSVTKSIGQLLREFYDDFHPDDAHPFMPLGWVLDPEKNGERIFGKLGSFICAPYRRGFYIVIEKAFGQLFGPHACRLMYKSYQLGEPIWVAILQLSAPFAMEEKMKEALREAISTRQFFHSEQTAETQVYV